MNKPPFGVLIANLGTPEAPTAKAVRAYLREFLSDRRVVDVPRILWWLILNLVILVIRPPRVAKAYAKVWGPEGSPLMTISRAQQRALGEALKAEYGQDIPVELAMTYGKPTMEEAGRALRKAGAERLIILPMYPQNSSSTTAAVHDRYSNAMAPCPHVPAARWITDYHVHPGYIAALANSVREHWAEHGQGDRLMMSFHGIPQRYENRGDPYPGQCRATAAALAEKLGLSEDQWICSFQSRFGREEWVKPYTDHTLEDWGKAGVGRVDIISPAFAADCLETLEELDMENRETFLEAGGKEYHYIPCLNDRPDHIDMMVTLVKENAGGWG
ncbi:ferrochelatase [Thalassolituus maritimus]|uniref:Ferrochelatase n=1 Tax=Thalassolituus maritimus TaxID=484498 RepID=A0ABP9ZVK5_9GAMM